MGRPLDPDRTARLFSRRLPEPRTDVTDRELESVLVEHGMPRADLFTQYRATLPQQYLMLRTMALRFYLDVVNARRGDPDAKERVDYCRETWQAIRRHRADQALTAGRDSVIL